MSRDGAATSALLELELMAQNLFHGRLFSSKSNLPKIQMRQMQPSSIVLTGKEKSYYIKPAFPSPYPGNYVHRIALVRNNPPRIFAGFGWKIFTTSKTGNGRSSIMQKRPTTWEGLMANTWLGNQYRGTTSSQKMH